MWQYVTYLLNGPVSVDLTMSRPASCCRNSIWTDAVGQILYMRCINRQSMYNILCRCRSFNARFVWQSHDDASCCIDHTLQRLDGWPGKMRYDYARLTPVICDARWRWSRVHYARRLMIPNTCQIYRLPPEVDRDQKHDPVSTSFIDDNKNVVSDTNCNKSDERNGLLGFKAYFTICFMSRYKGVCYNNRT